MPFHRESRRAHRLIGGMLGSLLAVSLVAVAGPSRAAGDDYPYRGLGQCPLVPLPPHPHDKPGKPGSNTKPNGHTKPGHGKPDAPDKPAPPRECAKHIWYYNGTYGDPWGFALRNCTSFVAWRLRETNGLGDFSNQMAGSSSFGNAENWDDEATSLGYLVDDVPAVGAVAQTDDGRVGHVAWVSAVGDGTVTVEEYNYYVAGGYDVRTVPASDFRYLHLADVAPDPSLGSTRAAATTAAPGGGTWTARISAHDDLTVTTTSARPVLLGPHVAWASNAAPSIAADTLGRTWVAAVATDGRVLTAHTRGTTDRWTRPRPVKGGPWSTTATPTLALDGHGRMQLLTVSAVGDLISRHTTDTDGWGRRDRLGAPGSWSTHTAPAAATDARGHLWIVAVTRHGTLEAAHALDRARPWSRFHAVDRRTWSQTSSPALTLAGDGRLWLTAVTTRGELISRHTGAGTTKWGRAVEADGRWSPYSSPSTTVDVSGRLWLAAVRTDGSVIVDSAAPGSGQWRSPRELVRRLPVTSSTSLIAPEHGGVRVGIATSRGRPVWRRAGHTVPLPVSGIGPRAGAFESPLGLAIHV